MNPQRRADQVRAFQAELADLERDLGGELLVRCGRHGIPYIADSRP